MAHPQLNTTTLDFVGAAGNSILSILKALSLLNRRSYRCGYVYSVDYIEFIPSSADPAGWVNNQITIAKIPENYNSLGAYRLGFEVWRQQRADAIEDTGIEPGKWSDFKPWFNADHEDGTLAELDVKGMGAGFILQSLDQTGSEWNMADMVIHDIDPGGGATTTTVLPVGMLGDDNGSIYGSLINAWGETRRATLSPDPLISDQAHLSWITRTGEEIAAMSGEVIELIDTENDVPPYANQPDTGLAPTYVGNGESAPLGMLVDMSVTGSTGRSVNLNGGLFPLGYIVVATDAQAYTLRVHCSRGRYKGVSAKSMGGFR